MPGQAGDDWVKILGAEIRQRRMARGMSLRALAKQLHMSGHGGLVDYELGRRIPPEYLVDGCERVFDISDGALRNLREKALAARAAHHTDRLLAPPGDQTATPDAAVEETAEQDTAGPDGGDLAAARHRTRRRLLVGVPAVALLAAAGVGAGVWWWRDTSSTSPAPPVRIAFDRPSERWGIFWGNQVAQSRITDVTGYRGGHALQVTVTGSSNNHGYSAVGTTHELQGLHTGVKVSFWLRVAQPEADSGVRFWVYNSADKPAWAPETPRPGTELPLPDGTTWSRYRWTVPTVDQVTAIGMQIYSATEQPLTVWLGAVDW